ncbi:MAG TPA: hypothetical protein IAA77_07160 [Candidatus Avibacteroides excrementipullorum]|nr:hypothetical protein [Candidatus Avibacteroides excrementipullorum]
MIILSVAQATALPAKAEMPVHTMQQDTAGVCPQEKKAFWRTAAEVAGFNVGLWLSTDTSSTDIMPTSHGTP